MGAARPERRLRAGRGNDEGKGEMSESGETTEREHGRGAPGEGREKPQPLLIERIMTRFVGVTRETREKYRELQHVLFTVRATIYVSLLGVVVFAVPDQIMEIYRLFAEDFLVDGDFAFKQIFTISAVRLASFFTLLYIACYALWYIGRVLTLLNDTTRAALDIDNAEGRVARWAPRVIGAAPAFAAAFGMARAEATRIGDIETDGLYVGAGVAFLIGVWRIWASWRRVRRVPETYANMRRTWLNAYGRGVLTVLLLSGVVYLMTQPIVFTQIVGALAIICFFMIALVFGWAQLTALNDRFAIPAVGLLVGAALVFAAFDLNDNHAIRELQPSPERMAAHRAEQAAAEQVFGPVRPVTIGSSFEEWYAARADLAAYAEADKPYPVYIVAAQGGGLYAAYQSSVFLAALLDECPTFAQHVFAVSGVSGGSVGGAVFTAIAAEHAENMPIESVDAPCGERPEVALASAAAKADAMLRQDFLSPLVSATLFGDFTARFSPVPIESFDRARALERAFELSWNAGRPVGAPPLDTTPLELGLLTYWDPAGAAPLVFFNTTEAETGRRMIMTPVPTLGAGSFSYASAVERRPDGLAPDVRLSTASMLSARFPYITPGGTMRLGADVEAVDGAIRRVRLVDGGYIENSGVDTALEIIRAIRRVEDRLEGPRIDIRLIVFDLTQDRVAEPTRGFGEGLTPIRAILAARESQTGRAQLRARRELGAPCRYVYFGGARPPGATIPREGVESYEQICRLRDLAVSPVWSVSLNDYEYDFALGWILSADTLDKIRGQLGDSEDCRRRALSEGAAPASGALPAQATAQSEAEARRQEDDAVARHNSCVARLVIDQLQRRELPERRQRPDAARP